MLAHFTAQADLIPINPVIVDVAGGGRQVANPSVPTLSRNGILGRTYPEVHRWRALFKGKISKIFTKPWQGALWGIMTNLQTKENAPNYQNKGRVPMLTRKPAATPAEASKKQRVEGWGGEKPLMETRARELPHLSGAKDRERRKTKGNDFIAPDCAWIPSGKFINVPPNTQQ